MAERGFPKGKLRSSCLEKKVTWVLATGDKDVPAYSRRTCPLGVCLPHVTGFLLEALVPDPYLRASCSSQISEVGVWTCGFQVLC